MWPTFRLLRREELTPSLNFMLTGDLGSGPTQLADPA